MLKKNKECKDCRYKDHRKDIFPCNKYMEIGSMPLTCDDCRWWCDKKGIRPCDKFEWD